MNVCVICHNLRSLKTFDELDKHERKKLKDRELRERTIKTIGSDAFKLDARAKHLKHKYQITLSDYEEQYEIQNGNCGICEIPVTHTTGYVDHDHDTMEFRGILCQKCNTGIGMLGDTFEAVQKAANYLSS